MKLRYINYGDRDVICNEHGEPLENVVGYRCEQPEPSGPAILTVKVLLEPVEWIPRIESGQSVDPLPL